MKFYYTKRNGIIFHRIKKLEKIIQTQVNLPPNAIKQRANTLYSENIY